MSEYYINNPKSEELNAYTCTLHEASKEKEDTTTGKTEQFMIDTELGDFQVIDFDKFVQNSHQKVFSNLKSNDALYWTDNSYNHAFFVEFKNGALKNVKGYELRLKIYDSLICLARDLNTTLDSLKEQVTYVLVYNDSLVEIQNQVAMLANQNNTPQNTPLPKKVTDLKFLEGTLVSKVSFTNKDKFHEIYL